jgi:hypothetical protein
MERQYLPPFSVGRRESRGRQRAESCVVREYLPFFGWPGPMVNVV